MRIICIFLFFCLTSCGLDNGFQRNYIISQSEVDKAEVKDEK